MFYPRKNIKELQQRLTMLTDDNFVVVCYCAQWCRTCQGFETHVESLATRYPNTIFVWVDVEEHEELVVTEDLEDFPTILLQNKNGTLFFGPIPPFVEHLERLLQQAPSMPLTTSILSFSNLVIATTQ